MSLVVRVRLGQGSLSKLWGTALSYPRTAGVIAGEGILPLTKQIIKDTVCQWAEGLMYEV